MYKVPNFINSVFSFFTDPFNIDGLRKETSGFHRRMYKEAKAVSDKLDKISKNHGSLQEIKEHYEAKLAKVKENNKLYCLSIDSFGETIGDMAWMKWADGTYAWCNQNLIDGLLFTGSLCNTVGKTDNHIGAKAVEKFGVDNHDFGSYCQGSDEVTIENGQKTRFLEFGCSGGKPLVLDVIKSPVFNDNGDIIATTGIGRDVTDRVFTLIELSQDTQDMLTKDGIERLVNSHVYLGDKPSNTLFEFYNYVKEKV